MHIVEIPVLPHVKRFLISLNGAEPLQANENNLIGKEIQNILHSYSQLELFPSNLPIDTISINISARVASYYMRFEHAFDLGCFFEKQFNLAIFSWVQAQMEAGVCQDQAIRNFYKRHGVDPDSYDVIAARMSITRMRKRAPAEA